MKELNLNEMSEISGGIFTKLILGMAIGAACEVGIAAFADRLCSML